MSASAAPRPAAGDGLSGQEIVFSVFMALMGQFYPRAESHVSG